MGWSETLVEESGTRRGTLYICMIFLVECTRGFFFNCCINMFESGGCHPPVVLAKKKKNILLCHKQVFNVCVSKVESVKRGKRGKRSSNQAMISILFCNGRPGSWVCWCYINVHYISRYPSKDTRFFITLIRVCGMNSLIGYNITDWNSL